MTRTNHLKDLTPEQRAEMREKARLAHIARAEYAANNLKVDYADDTHWTDLAKKYNVRLCNRTSPASEIKYMRRLMKALNIDAKEYSESCGVRNLKELAELNSDWTARAMCGVLLEYFDESVNQTSE